MNGMSHGLIRLNPRSKHRPSTPIKLADLVGRFSKTQHQQQPLPVPGSSDCDRVPNIPVHNNLRVVRQEHATESSGVEKGPDQFRCGGSD